MKVRTLGTVVLFLSIGGAMGCGSHPSGPPTDVAHARALNVGGAADA